MARLAARRRYRAMSRRLASLDADDRRYGVGNARPARVRRPRGVVRARVLTVVGVLVLAGVVGWIVVGGEALEVDAGYAGFPRPPADARSERILPAVAAATHGPHRFMTTRPDGSSVTYDPCRPIHYRVNPDGMPPGGLDVVHSAVAEIGAATGLAFVDDGTTDEPMVAQRPARQPDRYGAGWAPVLVAWVDPAQYPLLTGDVVGVGGSTAVTPDGPADLRYVTGTVALDRGFFRGALATGHADDGRTVVLHELGHLVGLDHVSDPDEIMNPTRGAATDLGPGDREGLALVGSGPCGS